MKKSNLFQDMLILLHDNIFPSITTSLQEMSMEYCHISIPPEFSMTFFNYMRIGFPFAIENLLKENETPVVILSIRKDGQISLAENFDMVNGTIQLRNNIVFSDDISDFFKLRFENNFLYYISNQLSQRAAQFEKEKGIIYELLDNMSKIRPKLKRNILVEKLQKNY